MNYGFKSIICQFLVMATAQNRFPAACAHRALTERLRPWRGLSHLVEVPLEDASAAQPTWGRIQTAWARIAKHPIFSMSTSQPQFAVRP